MYFKEKRIKGKNYKYAVHSIRLPNGKVIPLEKRYNQENKEQLSRIFEKKEKEENAKYAIKQFGTNSIFTKDQLEKVEEIRLDYKKILKKLTKFALKDLLDRFTANFTYESNALEGNSLTLKDVSIIMFENHAVKGKDLREIYETRNSRNVVDLIIKNKFRISHEDIIRMHKMLIKDIPIQQGYKKLPNFLIGREMRTTLPESVFEEISGLIEWHNQEKNNLHPLKLAALFHGKFEQIHPFEDGNGRVGRFLINVILIKNNYPPLIIRKSQRMAYLKALENFDNKHTETLQRFMLDKFKDTYKKFFKIYVKYV